MTCVSVSLVLFAHLLTYSHTHSLIPSLFSICRAVCREVPNIWSVTRDRRRSSRERQPARAYRTRALGSRSIHAKIACETVPRHAIVYHGYFVHLCIARSRLFSSTTIDPGFFFPLVPRLARQTRERTDPRWRVACQGYGYCFPPLSLVLFLF